MCGEAMLVVPVTKMVLPAIRGKKIGKCILAAFCQQQREVRLCARPDLI